MAEAMPPFSRPLSLFVIPQRNGQICCCFLAAPEFSRLWNKLQLFHVRQVAQPACLPLILHQVGLRNVRHCDTIEACLDAVSPYLVEAHLTDRSKQIDMIFARSETEVFAIVQQVTCLDPRKRDT